MTRQRHLQKCMPELAAKIEKCKVLMVGAGGIGCELLKNLVLTGFGEVHLLDLDTIDLSNLNRQFLFQKQHIKKSKALVAKETATKFNPNVKLHAYHANIKDDEYNVSWFKQFDLVFNALDNLDARRHVNKMCLAADVPLIESGTTGFRGQVQVIVKAKTECYDCNPKEVPKSFPICTIRSTPSQPIHCIVWAKSYLFNQLFGVDEDEVTLDVTANADNSEEIMNLRKEASALALIKDKMGTPDFAKAVFEKVFDEDVRRLLSVEEMWKSRTPPKALDYDSITKDMADKSSPAKQDQLLWSLEQNLAVFRDSLERLSQRMAELRQSSTKTQPSLSFDKDDEDTLDFVAATANIRAHVFGIDMKTKFDIKQMAGNIIAAIATTNAIIAGVCVLQAFKVLQSNLNSTKTIFLSRRPERVFNNESMAPPQPDCAVCGISQVVLEADTARMTLRDLVEDVLQGTFKYTEEISILTDNLIYDPDFDDNLDKTLQELHIINNTFITVIDDDENDEGKSRVNLQIIVQHDTHDKFKPPTKIDIPYKARSLPEPDQIVPVATEKRKRPLEETAEEVSKKRKLTDQTIEIQDDDEIVIE